MSTEVRPPIQEYTYPEEDSVAKLDSIFYFLGEVTSPSRAAGTEPGEAGRIERSLLTRKKRAELLQQFKQTPQEDKATRMAILEEAKIRDQIAEQFLRQGEVTVTLPTMGEMSARYNKLEGYQQKEAGEIGKDPIVIIPGISNDIGCVGAMAQELAYMGRDVLTLGYPEGFLGKVAPEFTQEVERSHSFQPHADFFQEAINALTPNQSIELWGLSTGGPIAGAMLANEEMQEKVSEAVFVSPAACVDQSKMQFQMGMAREAGSLIRQFHIIPQTIWTTGRKTEKDEEHLRERKKIMGALMKTIQRDSKVWDKVKVREGGNVIVVTGGNDQITKSFLAEDEFKKHGFHVLSVPDANHTMTMNDPEILSDVFSLREALNPS